MTAGEANCITSPLLSARPDQSKTTVLVVDDSPDMLRYLRVLLELDSYQVETASNGIEALQRVRDGCIPAVVLLDLQMPRMDGLKTLRRLRKLRPELKVIMCSGVADPDKVQRAAALGAQAYLIKPVKHLYLSAALERCLTLNSTMPAEESLGAGLAALPSPLQSEKI
jgi:CheY-like chemotaxis protein